jgi:membrane fusion protein YbhG
MMWKTALASVGLIVAAALALGFFWPFGRRPETLRLTGVVEIQEVRLGSKIGGRVQEVLVSEGDVIHAGRVLVRFEAPELRAQRDQWRAQVRATKAAWAKAEHGPRPQEIEQGRADLASARADEKLAAQNFTRVDQLYQTNALARADFDAAHAAVVSARARSGMARARLDLLEAGTRTEEKDEAHAQYLQAVGKLQEIEANLKETTVAAPELAIVDVLAVRKGDLVPPNQPILRVLRIGDLWVKVYVPETELGKVRLGQDVEVTIDSYPGQRFPGTIFFIAAQSEFTPRNVQSLDERRHQVFGIKVRVAQPADPEKRIFKSGMAAEVFVPLRESP